MTEAPRYPGYDVLAKRDTPSWDATTRAVIDARLTTPTTPRFLTPAEWTIADALCRRILPRVSDAMPLVALLDAKLLANHGDGFREVDMPYMQEAWRTGLAAIDGEAKARHGRGFALLTEGEQDRLLAAMQAGEIDGAHWAVLAAKTFFERRILADIPALYYSLPSAWNEIGFGGPASPRGYVRLDGDRPDPWEAVQAEPGKERQVERE
ncbi:MAG: gluconate 2-dehydrogenase subunit 3 family protein, partial [Pseudomonadota bacterium]|nr:gluconate 2-dehydrogenase subunit 3 family protein [Pseudomonadota bacterium]